MDSTVCRALAWLEWRWRIGGANSVAADTRPGLLGGPGSGADNTKTSNLESEIAKFRQPPIAHMSVDIYHCMYNLEFLA